jgi:hypothetical protein
VWIINIYRIDVVGFSNILNNPIIKINEFGTGNYKKIIKQALKNDVKLFTLKEYNKKIVDYCSLFDKTVEDEFIYLPTFFKEKMEIIFVEKGPVNIGVVFDNSDFRLGEKIVLNVCKYARFLSVINYRNSDRLQEKILDFNGLTINIENSIEKIEKKCDIIIDINQKINEEGYK